MKATSVRLFRVRTSGPPRLVLKVGERALDLSAWLASHDQSADLAGLFARGFFERAHLEQALAGEGWEPCAQPVSPLVPVEPLAVGKILALGKNFREHAAEFGEAVPEEPLFFEKLPETLVPDGATVGPPAGYDGRFDHEAELAVVIGRGGVHIDPARALEHVAGFTVANDLTLRTLQGADRAKKFPWFRSKNFDGACPLGPCLVPRDFFDLGDARVQARVSHADPARPQELRQDASTRDLVVDVPHALAFLSAHLTLHPLDVILMGTPAGVGALADGDEVVCSVSGIGELKTRISRPVSVKA